MSSHAIYSSSVPVSIPTWKIASKGLREIDYDDDAEVKSHLLKLVNAAIHMSMCVGGLGGGGGLV